MEEKGREEGRVVRVGRKEAGVKSRDEAEQSWVGEVGRERERQRRRDGGGGRRTEVRSAGHQRDNASAGWLAKHSVPPSGM